MNVRKIDWMLAVCMFLLSAFCLISSLKINRLDEDCNNMREAVIKMENEVIDLKLQINKLNEKEIAVEEKEKEIEAEIEINWDYEYVLRVVTAESKGEPLEGQMAVAQCIRTTSEVTGMTPEEVVKQVNNNGTRQYARPDNIDEVNDSVREACERVFILGESVTDEPIRYFYSIRNGGYSSWHENSLTYVTTIGNHKFFKAK